MRYERLMMRLPYVACFGTLVGLIWLFAVHPHAEARPSEGIRTFPTRQNHPEKIQPGFVSLGKGTTDLGRHSPRNFGWFAVVEKGRASTQKGRPCFRVAVAGPLIRGGGPGQSGDAECLVGAAASAVVSAPLEGSTDWSALDVGVAAYKNDVESVRLVLTQGESKVVPTRQIGRNLSVPGLGSLYYVVFAVSGCVKRVEAEDEGQATTVTKFPECDVIPGR